MTIAALSPVQILGLLLIVIRIGGMMVTAPVLSSPRVPPLLRAGISLLLAFVLQPLVVPPEPAAATSLLVVALLVAKEALTGLIIGFTANLIFSVVQMAGEVQDTQAGFGFASVVDPTMGAHGAIIGQFQTVLMWLLFFAINGHQLLMQGIADSFTVIPLGGGNFAGGLALHMGSLLGALMLMALRIAAPVMCAALLANLAIGMLQRTAPQLNLLAVGFQVTVAVTLLALVAGMPFIAQNLHGLVPWMARITDDVMRVMAGR